MRNEIFVNVGPCETRVAVREGDKFTDLHIERADERGVVSGIFKGRVTRVLPGMQAAFVDIGLDRAGFLYVADYRADLDDVDLDDDDEAGNGNGNNGGGNRGGRGRRGGGRARRDNLPQIEDILEEGREILVQVSKEPLGTKGARITSRISLPGRHLVLMPAVPRVGVSRRIEGDRERRRLRAIVEKYRPKDLGFIVRTVSHGVSEADIKADIEYLSQLWEGVKAAREAATEVPALIYQEPPLHLRVLRDFTTHETKRIVVDDADAYGEMQEFARKFMATPRPKIKHYREHSPLFDAQRIEPELEEALGRKVWLKSGGYLVIDQSEALTAIDVNTGRYTGGKGRNLEDTILKTNLEAAREIVHQLRFRNLGGLIILDLIDMESAQNRDKVYKALNEALREDKSRVNVLRISELGLVEMTRKRTRESLGQQLCEPCPTCEGKGYLQTATTIANKILRELPKAATYQHGSTLRVEVSPDVEEILSSRALAGLERAAQNIGRMVEIEANPWFHREQFEIASYGEKVDVLLPELPPTPEIAPDDEELVADEGIAADEGVAVDEGIAAGAEAPAPEAAEAEADTNREQREGELASSAEVNTATIGVAAELQEVRAAVEDETAERQDAPVAAVPAYGAPDLSEEKPDKGMTVTDAGAEAEAEAAEDDAGRDHLPAGS